MEIRDEIAYPDPQEARKLRRLRAVLLVAIPAVLCGAWFWIQANIPTLGDSNADMALAAAKLRQILAIMSIAIAIPTLLFGGWIVVIGRRTLRARQWPYPGATLLRATPVVRGHKATVRAAALLVLGAFLALAGPATGAFLYFGVGAFLQQADTAIGPK